MEVINALGRRKTAVARVYLTKGNGKISINKREMTEFFPIDFLQAKVHQPFALTGTAGQYDITKRCRWWYQRSGRSSSFGYFPRTCRNICRLQTNAQSRRPHDARPTNGRAQETRSTKSKKEIPVLQALIRLLDCLASKRWSTCLLGPFNVG